MESSSFQGEEHRENAKKHQETRHFQRNLHRIGPRISDFGPKFFIETSGATRETISHQASTGDLDVQWKPMTKL